MRKPRFWFPTWSNTDQAVQLQKVARGLKIRISKVSASLFSHMQNVGFLMTRLICVSATECYNSSSTYKGRRTCSKSGRLCLRWDAVSHSFTDSSFPDNNMTLSEAYCRDPDGFLGVPWCYTGHPATPKEECGIQHCSSRFYIILTPPGTHPYIVSRAHPT